MKAASLHCTTLFELSILRLPTLTADVKFESLTVLRLKYVNTIAELTSMLENSPNLRKLHIDHIFRGQCEESLIDALLGQNLRVLYICAEPLECQRIYDLIEGHPQRNLDILELHARTLNYSKCFQFRFTAFSGVEPNFEKQAEEMNDEFKDFLLLELLALVNMDESAHESDDAAIINHVMNSFEFS